MRLATTEPVPLGPVVSDASAIARCRELLGSEGEGLTDREIEQMQRHADAMARLIVEMFLQRAA